MTATWETSTALPLYVYVEHESGRNRDEYIFLVVEILLSFIATLNRQPSSRQYHRRPLNSMWSAPQTGSAPKKPLTFVWFALLSELTCGLHSRFTSVLVQIRIAHYFAADELVLKIRVDDASCLRGLRSLADGPGTHFIRSACEIPNQLGARHAN